ncbi:class I SAM-dependent methyltransferase [Saccharothrix sp. AJ9571]|nr:class I SAM-dependent methyltransferase [Saccharothrix sp. AJ9571]
MVNTKSGQLSPAGTGTDGDEEAAKTKAAVSSTYDMIAANWNFGILWNWGYHDPGLQQELEEIIPGFNSFDTDGFSELLYYYALRQVPLSIADYRGKRVLEVGSGIGAGLAFLSRVIDGAEMSGMDISKTAVDRANARYSRGKTLSFTVGDAESMPFDDGVFDVVVNVESSHLYPRLDGFFNEVARVLKPGGHLSMVDLFTDQQMTTFDKAASECGRLDWVAENDISPQVKASVRQRMTAGSYLLRSFSKEKMSPLKRVVVKHGLMASLGAAFTGEASTKPLAKWARKVTGLSTVDTAPVRAYRHHLATRIP